MDLPTAWINDLTAWAREYGGLYLIGTLGAIAVIAGTGAVLFKRWATRTTLKTIATSFRFIWSVGLTFGFLFYIVRYKLEIDKYFPSYYDVLVAHRLYEFLASKWEVILLGIVLLLTFLFLNVDSGRYVEHAESCFSSRRMPTRWTVARGRYLIMWVVFSNIAIFLALANFIDNVVAFSALFLAHHLNTILWITAFRWNVDYYFYDLKYMPPDDDPYRSLIYERRSIMNAFICKTRNIEKEGLTAIAYGVSLLLAVASQKWHWVFYAVPHLTLATAETANQYLSHTERRDRDRGLRRIAEEEHKLSTSD